LLNGRYRKRRGDLINLSTRGYYERLNGGSIEGENWIEGFFVIFIPKLKEIMIPRVNQVKKLKDAIEYNYFGVVLVW